MAETHLGGIRLLLPDWSSLNYVATTIAAGAFVAMFKLHWSVFRTLGVACIVGLLPYLAIKTAIVAGRTGKPSAGWIFVAEVQAAFEIGQ